LIFAIAFQFSFHLILHLELLQASVKINIHLNLAKMKNLSPPHPRLAIVLFFGIMLSSTVSYAEEVTLPRFEEIAGVVDLKIVSGPTGKVCPNQTYTFRATANLKGCFRWRIRQNGTWYGPTYPTNCGNPAASTSNDFTYTFLPGAGTITVEVKWVSLPPVATTTTSRTLVMELGAPAPTLATNGLKFCSVNETQQITIAGLNRSNDPNNCDYHFEYEYEVSRGWTINAPPPFSDSDPAINRVRSHSRTINVVAGSSQVEGTLTVRTRHPNFTTQRTSTIKLRYGPYTASVLNGPPGGSGSSFVQVNAPNLPGLTSGDYQWRVVGDQGGTYASQSGGRFFQFYLPPAGFGAVEVQLTVPDRCRSTPTAVLKLFIFEYGDSYSVYPNPADDYIDITAQSVESANNSISMPTVASNTSEAPSFTKISSKPVIKPFHVKLLDAQAKVLHEAKAQDGKLRIDVSRLKEGNYYLHIQESSKALTKMPILIE
jgi:hypothetical protein